jgi:hypothetical protein
MAWREPNRPHRVSTRLTYDELKALRKVRKYVAGWDSQRNSFAEALRFLVRNWSREDNP